MRRAYAPAPPPLRLKGTLRVLTVGVSKYADKSLKLRFADADAQELAALFREQQGLYARVSTTILVNEQATRTSIERALDQLAAEAQSDDVVVIAFSGHGALEPGDRYYFVPYDANWSSLANRGLSMGVFQAKLAAILARASSVVLVLDTCFAGGVSGGALQGASMAKGIQGSRGLYVLNSSTFDQESLERGKLGHGAFVYAILAGLKGDADRDGNRLINVVDIGNYAQYRVPELTAGNQQTSSVVSSTGEGTNPVLAYVPYEKPPPPPPPPDCPADPYFYKQVAKVRDPDFHSERIAKSAPRGPASPSPTVVSVGKFRAPPGDRDADTTGLALKSSLLEALRSTERVLPVDRCILEAEEAAKRTLLPARLLVAGEVPGTGTGIVTWTLTDVESTRLLGTGRAELDDPGAVDAVTARVVPAILDVVRENYPIEGEVLSAEGDVILNVGRLHGVKPGQRLVAFATKPIEVGGEVRAHRKIDLGTISVTSVEDKVSFGTLIESKGTIAAGTKVIEERPRPGSSD